MKKLAILALMALPFLFACSQEEANLEVKVTRISLNKPSLDMYPGGTARLKATITPLNATDQTLVWNSNDTGVASVQDGLVTAVAPGEAVITVSCGGKNAQCNVTVKEPGLVLSTISSGSPLFMGLGGSDKVTVSSSDNWTVSSSADWLTLSSNSGNSGESELTLTAAENTTGGNREATVTFTAGARSANYQIKQRANPYTITVESSGQVNNSLKINYSRQTFNRLFCVLPRPVSNFYQTISDFSAEGCTEVKCEDGVNTLLTRDLVGKNIPASGGSAITETFNVVVNHITVDFSKVTDIPEYDTESDIYKKYTVAESGDLVSPGNSTIASTANSLWAQSNEDLITYARKCFEWTHSHITYGNYLTGLHTITNLMSSRTGDCGNYCSVFISLLRAKKIPSRHVVMLNAKNGEPHIRSEFFVPAYGWIPVDPTWGEDYFGLFDTPFVIMSQGINITIDNPFSPIMADLVQTYFYWYIGSAGDLSFSQTISGL